MDYKKIRLSRLYNKWNNYYINVPNGVKDQIQKYSPIKLKDYLIILFRDSKGSKPFRTSKNKCPIGYFKKFNGGNDVEPLIPKVGFIPPGINSNNIQNADNEEINPLASPSAGAPALNYGDVNTETTSPGEVKGLILIDININKKIINCLLKI